MHSDDRLKLYVKAACSVCLAGRREGVFLMCPYCDIDRNQIIEASFTTIKDILQHNLNPNEKKELIKFLKEK